MTRTLWVTNDFPPRAGGIEVFVSALVGGLDPAVTHVLASAFPGDRDHDAAVAYRVDRVGRRPLLPGPRLLARVRAAADDAGAEVVVFGAAWPLARLAGELERPTLALTHGHEAGMARAGAGRLVRRAVRDVDAVGVISAFTRRALEPWIPRGVQVHPLSPGVDTAAFHPAVDTGEVRARHGIAEDTPLVLCVSRLVPRKGQDVLIDGWPDVLARVPGAHLLLVGSGPHERSLRRQVDRLGLTAQVTFAGIAARGDLPAYHAAADVFAMPCRSRLGGLDVEGLGIVYLEAQAAGTPVVAGRSGGAPEAVVDGETGLVVDGTDRPAVAAVVAGLLTDPDRRERMGAAGRAFVEERFAWPVIFAGLRGLLADLRPAGG